MEPSPEANPEKPAAIGNALLAGESQEQTDPWSGLRRRLFNLDISFEETVAGYLLNPFPAEAVIAMIESVVQKHSRGTGGRDFAG